MKFDYKQKKAQMKSPILQRTLHVSLGFIVFICLMVVLSSYKNNPGNTAQAPEAVAALVNLPIDIPANNTSAPTNAIANPTENAETKLAMAEPLTKQNSLLATPEENLTKAMPETESSNTITESDTTQNEISPTLHTIKVRQGDTLTKVLTKLKVSHKGIQEVLSKPAARGLKTLRPGQVLNIQIDNSQQLASLTLDLAPGSTIYISRKEDEYEVEHKITPLEKQIAFGRGEIHNSLFSAGKQAGLDQNILAQMVEIFGWSIDFALDLQPNDTFRVLYEEKCLDGERIQTGHILAAEIINDGTKYQAVRYTDKSGKTGYFSPDGYGMHQAFLRTPVNFTRISSHFGQRKHPILHHMRHHKGVDYSAPHGTPVQATGDGKVVFAGRRSGYGNVVELQHGSRYSTLYAHLSKFPKNIKVGTEVAQGQVIGYVGRTGLATGDHLHYEFRVDGIHRDPLTAVPKKNPIVERNKRHFMAHAKEMMRLLDLHEDKINMARTEYPVNE